MSFLKRSMNIIKGITQEITQGTDPQKMADLDAELRKDKSKTPAPKKKTPPEEMDSTPSKKKEVRAPKKRTL